MSARSRQVLFWGLIVTIIVLDVITKGIAEGALAPRGVPREVVGDWVRLTLVYNTGAAFGISLGPYSRWLFLTLALIALVILARLYRQTPDHDRFRIASIGLVCAGAVGNVIDRIRHPMGVVDFIDIGIGVHRWPTFNVADMAVSIGAFMLAWSLWAEDRARVRPARKCRVRRSARKAAFVRGRRPKKRNCRITRMKNTNHANTARGFFKLHRRIRVIRQFRFAAASVWEPAR